MHVFFLQKTSQKPFQNEVRTLPKSMPKTCCFLTSIFSGFGSDFGGSWASKLEPSWLLKPLKTSWEAHFYLLKLKVFKKWRLGGLRARFRRPRGSIFDLLGRIFQDFGPECQESQERQERLPKQDRDHKSAKSGWAAVLPPRGVSIK